MTTVSPTRLARVFVEVADTLVDEFDLLEFLNLLVSRAGELLNDSPVGLLLADARGRLRFVAASSENVKLLELFQVQALDGPCLEAYRNGTSVINVDLEQATPRWPKFAPRAVAAGFRSVHAFPLRLRQERIGALNVFSTTVGGTLADGDIEIIQALADVASIGLLQERAIKRAELLTEQLQAALNSRILIEQAKGAVAQAQGVSVSEAFDLIRAYARRNNRRLSDVAHALVTDFNSINDFAAS